MIKDIGKLLGIYFSFIACIEIIIMFYNQDLTGDLFIQLSFLVNFLIGYYLFNHNSKARKFVIVFSGVMMLLQSSVFIYYSINEIPETSHIRLFGIEISNLVRQEQLSTLFAISIIFPSIPFFLLRTKQAMSEFSKKEQISTSESQEHL